MSEAFEVRKINLPCSGFDVLAIEAEAMEHMFLHRMGVEWANGENQFKLPGEMMLGAFEGNLLIAVGGLNQCPYSNDPIVGRLRHLYVSSAHRNKGIAGTLIGKIISSAAENFEIVRLRTNNPAAIALYEQNGFVDSADHNASHEIKR